MKRETFNNAMGFINKYLGPDGRLDTRAIRANVLGTVIGTRNYLDSLRQKETKRNKVKKNNRNI